MKNLLYLLAFTIVFSSCKSSSIVTSKSSKKSTKSSNQLAENIIESATDNLGIRYKTAGTTRAGYDCSGLVFTVYSEYNVKLPRTSIQQSQTGINLGKDISKAEKGDLIFFKTNNRSQINHVGIVTEVYDDELQFIHTSTSKGVILSSTKEAYYQKTFAQINRVLF
ncbi:cell wall-associated NlpC family hydrolase [Flavobacterium sp. 28A]|uniref:C40 family peptidase n=1 Tax=Flavobacterium sp. 28A TaxID=2735895 RepID=UPI00156D4C86|nr:C40 family peptidase [Flavobacterium sp. 28A]NRT16069.1 cell wall-associated NlpC family hydrolase [Flavobacterium sp. 28A]